MFFFLVGIRPTISSFPIVGGKRFFSALNCKTWLQQPSAGIKSVKTVCHSLVLFAVKKANTFYVLNIHFTPLVVFVMLTFS